MSVHPVEPKERVAEQGESNLCQTKGPAESTPVASQDGVGAEGETGGQERPSDAPVVAPADIDRPPPIPPVTGPPISVCRRVQMPPPRWSGLLPTGGSPLRAPRLAVHRMAPPVLTWQRIAPCKREASQTRRFACVSVL